MPRAKSKFHDLDSNQVQRTTIPDTEDQPPGLSPASIAEQADPLASARLITAETAAAVGGMGTSWWYEKVRAGIAPQPVIRGVRCTRWRAVDVAEFWRRVADTAGNHRQLASDDQGGVA